MAAINTEQEKNIVMKRCAMIVSILCVLSITFLHYSNVYAFSVLGNRDTPKWGYSNLNYRYDSSFTILSWQLSGDVAASNWTQRGTPVNFSLDQASDISIFAEDLGYHPYNPFTLGATDIYYIPGGHIVGSRIAMNNNGSVCMYNGSGPVPSNCYDLKSVMRHEFGHSIGLCHTDTAGSTMHPTYNIGDSRPVDDDAANGASWLYNDFYTGPGPEVDYCISGPG